MSELLVRPEKFTDRIESFGYEYLSFEARKLAAGGQYAAETGANELAIVVLGGVCSVTTPLESLAAHRRTQQRIRRPALHAVPAGGDRILRSLPIPIATWPSATAAPKSVTRRAW